jgi:pimeloyl-ACP methyl ester carboxylesterase
VADESAGQVATRDGRTLAYLEVGDPHGPLVLHNHGGPSSRLEACLLADSASKKRLRLVCVDRPGMGQSSPPKARTYAGWADDLVTIADALGHDEFGVTGWSEGGPWALAAADRMPGAVWHPVEGAGHFVAVGDADDIFRTTAEELGAH